MNQEDKKLLLKDLCARLPYGVKCWHPYGVGELDSIDIEEYGIDVTFKTCDDNYYDLSQCKPYLRPLSSMTEEENEEYLNLFDGMFNITYSSYVDMDYPGKIIDFFNIHHLDYRGLIKKGLALQAPKGMYKTEEL